MNAPLTAEKKPSIEIVYAAVCELSEQGMATSRNEIQKESSLPMNVVDDALKRLRDAGRLESPSRGFYCPKERHHPARPVSSTILTSGEVKLEVGEEVLTLTPREARMIATLMSGHIVKLVQEKNVLKD